MQLTKDAAQAHQRCSMRQKYHERVDGRGFHFREGPPQKKGFIWEIFPKYWWVGWLIPKQGPNP